MASYKIDNGISLLNKKGVISGMVTGNNTSQIFEYIHGRIYSNAPGLFESEVG